MFQFTFFSKTVPRDMFTYLTNECELVSLNIVKGRDIVSYGRVHEECSLQKYK